MRFGFVTVFAWRPHVEHMHYLAGLAREAGHEVHSLVCDADLPACYTRELHARQPAWLECAKCRAGGLRSFESHRVTSIGELRPSIRFDDEPRFQSLARSSASTLGRYESNADYDAPAFELTAKRLAPAIGLAYDAARRWIARQRLDAVFLFNGRIDATRGVLEAARAEGVRFVTLERTWFGDGIQLLPDETCLGLRSIGRLMSEWRDVPLAEIQARRAARIAASRFLGRNANEWRAYNIGGRAASWPVPRARRRILLLPGSRNEVWGFTEVEGRWTDRSVALDSLIDRLGLRAEELVLRCHPNWNELIGLASGEHSERYYSDWAHSRGIHVIGSRSRASTPALIDAADAIVVMGGSAALEAGILGKQVIALTPSIYTQGGFESRAYDERDIGALRLDIDLPDSQAHLAAERIARLTLRFVHTMVWRIAQFVPYVRLRTTTRYEYFEGAHAQRVTDLASTGVLASDDDERTSSDAAEREVLQRIAARDWESLYAEKVPPLQERRPLGRRHIYALVDAVRNRLPRGDL